MRVLSEESNANNRHARAEGGAIERAERVCARGARGRGFVSRRLEVLEYCWVLR